MPLSPEMSTRTLVENLKTKFTKGFVAWFAPLFETWEQERNRQAAEREANHQRAYEDEWPYSSVSRL